MKVIPSRLRKWLMIRTVRPLLHRLGWLFPRVGLAVIVLNGEGQVLLGRRLAVVGAGFYEFPGGHVEFFETWKECASRETLEETGLRIVNPRFVTATENIYRETYKQYMTVVMVARATNPADLTTMEGDKSGGWAWYDVDKLPSPIFEGGSLFTDGRTIRDLIRALPGGDTSEYSPPRVA